MSYKNIQLIISLILLQILLFLICLMFNGILKMIFSFWLINWSDWCYVLVIRIKLKLLWRWYLLMLILFLSLRCDYVLIFCWLFFLSTRNCIQFAVSTFMMNVWMHLMNIWMNIWMVIFLIVRIMMIIILITRVAFILNDIWQYFTPYLPVIVLINNFFCQYNFINVLLT